MSRSVQDDELQMYQVLFQNTRKRQTRKNAKSRPHISSRPGILRSPFSDFTVLKETKAKGQKINDDNVYHLKSGVNGFHCTAVVFVRFFLLLFTALHLVVLNRRQSKICWILSWPHKDHSCWILHSVSVLIQRWLWWSGTSREKQSGKWIPPCADTSPGIKF